ncbi:DUF262 domain-containing protein [Bosea sp. (in: a-proteobacteria)]|uniref:DUF262 domain-containing protein n=1 Tax=Bosea sp. (in: a-proteobacteria) TaxID=1871050 RepID=UPI004033DDE6
MSDLSSQPTPLQTIYNWYRGGALIVNRTYQRKLVWTLEEKRQLIDSILKEYPIPLVLLAEVEEAGQQRFEIMDGMQRLHTIVSFIEHGFSTHDEKYFNVEEFTRAKEEREKGTFKEVEGAELIERSGVSRILDYVLPVSVVRRATASEVTDIFGRINSYGHRLSDQERRQAGLISDLSKFVRLLSSEVRGDVSLDRLPLYQMPEISVDLATTKYGYRVQAADVFWVRQGVLRSTELRDSLDEQLIADISACILGDDLIERSKEALDDLYNLNSPQSSVINSRLNSYDSTKLAAEIKYCLEVIDKIVASGDAGNLRNLIFDTKTTNSFPTVFSAIFIAVHEISFKSGLILANSSAAYAALNNVQPKMNTTRNALSPPERRKNINIIKGLIQDSFVSGDISQVAFGRRRELDIENTLRRSEVEVPSFELKQGVVRLSENRELDNDVFDKVISTAAGIANISPNASGAIFVGVADTQKDADRISHLDKITPLKIGNRWIVGIDREAKVLKKSPEEYFHMWRDKIENSNLSKSLKSHLLSHMDLCLYKDRHILIIATRAQKTPSLFNGTAYARKADQTVAVSAEDLIEIATRFAS